jgi:hypothetical protein
MQFTSKKHGVPRHDRDSLIRHQDLIYADGLILKTKSTCYYVVSIHVNKLFHQSLVAMAREYGLNFSISYTIARIRAHQS